MSNHTRIVAINDDPVQLRLLSRVLESGGYDVAGYVDSAKALADLTDLPRVDLFVIDLHMPGIDGWKVCRLLRSPDFKAFNDTPILIVSATFTGADVEAITADIGADAFLALPFSREELLADVHDLLEGIRPRSRSRVLIVEDDDTVARALDRTFSVHGYETMRAANARDAAKMWADLRPDLVLLDYHLPDGTGTELLRRLQSPSDRTVVLVMTGDIDPKLPVTLLGLGADAYVRKPFDPELLVELAGKARRERSLLRVEALLERRTQELRSSETRYRALFDAIPDIVLTLDGGNRLARTNDAGAKALGPHLEDILGRPLTDFLPVQKRPMVKKILDEVRRKGHGHFETVLKGIGDRAHIIEVTATTNEDTDVGALLLVARDLTERRRAEEERRRIDLQMQHTQRLESLGVLAGGIAHDFNNLLVGVLGNASLALLDTDEGTPLHESITQIETAARRAAELTQQILTFSGKGDSVMAPLDLTSVVSEMGQLLAPAVSKKAKFVYRLGRDLPEIQGDPSQLRQVVMNLIMNASDALVESSGRVEVKTALVTLDEEAIQGHFLGEHGTPGDFVAFEVHDDGCGMDATTRNQIFDPFFTTKSGGRGLGLAATLGIVRSHGGLVAVDSEPDAGTRFTILFPAIRREETDGRPHADKGPGSAQNGGPSGGRILVVDDEGSVRGLAASALERAGFRVVAAADGEEGLVRLDHDEDVDLMVVDLALPGFVGMELLDGIRIRRPDIPVLLCSADPDDAEEVAKQGALAGFLAKPYDARQLNRAVAKLIRAARKVGKGRRRRERAGTSPG